jgi:hypothetical protein
VSFAPSYFAEDSSEKYVLTDEGRQLNEQYRNMPSDQAEGLFLNFMKCDGDASAVASCDDGLQIFEGAFSFENTDY